MILLKDLILEPYYAIGLIEHYEPYRWAWYIIVK